tara:strand:+ start:1682 stop:2449 length:768 start_codon:yes stop_codon:yes gene_type:complete
MIKNRLLSVIRKILDMRAKKILKSNQELWRTLNEYLKNSSSTGSNYSDYLSLYNYVKNNRPIEILECGTGVSTIILAQAFKDHSIDGRITSLESEKKYFDLALSILPKYLAKYIDIKLSPVIEDSYSLFRGCRYKDIPLDRVYDFVYIDGPSYKAPSDNTLTFDFDFLYILKQSDSPISAIVDKRISTCYVLQKVLGTHKVKYDSLRHQGFINNCTKNDIRHFSLREPSSAFSESFSIFKNSKLRLILKDFLYEQ